MPPNFLDGILLARKNGQTRGITSICSTHPWVLKAALSRAGSGVAAPTPGPVLIESTCNQVNQFGGYTGLTPAGFMAYVRALARETDFPLERLILGGDHLGPGVWKDEPAATAMQKAADLLRSYVQSGYTKIHLDASMRLGDDDPSRPLDVELVARRTAWLAQAAERACADLGMDCSLRYVIGSEVPIPGGATAHESAVSLTQVEDARRTLELMQAAFTAEGLGSAWERVIALVVQPGVEFGDDFVLDYHPAAARGLAEFISTLPLVYEAHSTDYQKRENLRALVRDGFAILKVGPALTFAFREAVFALVNMEDELFPDGKRSHLVEVLQEVMTRRPEYWQPYYPGDGSAQRLKRLFSLSDRIRYYWSDPQVQSALERLLQNLHQKPLPPALLGQFMPERLERLLAEQIEITPEALILDQINSVLEDYAFACG
jgi:D-tagatose-1,6-bisphosphate aldolase subunit GatZ/KbaZ